MKLIIERIGGQNFAYFETEKHFKNVEDQRPNKVDSKLLNDECRLDNLPPDCHMVFNLK